MDNDRDARVILSDHDISQLSRESNVGIRLLEEIISGGFTHPNIAERLQKVAGLTESEKNQLISSERVSINHHRSPKDWNNACFKVQRVRTDLNRKEAEYFQYKSQKYKKEDGQT